jgi:hypothetical protein
MSLLLLLRPRGDRTMLEDTPLPPARRKRGYRTTYIDTGSGVAVKYEKEKWLDDEEALLVLLGGG